MADRHDNFSDELAVSFLEDLHLLTGWCHVRGDVTWMIERERAGGVYGFRFSIFDHDANTYLVMQNAYTLIDVAGAVREFLDGLVSKK